MSKPVHGLQPGAEVEKIVNIAAIAVLDAQETERTVEVRTEFVNRFLRKNSHWLLKRYGDRQSISLDTLSPARTQRTG